MCYIEGIDARWFRHVHAKIDVRLSLALNGRVLFKLDSIMRMRITCDSLEQHVDLCH